MPLVWFSNLQQTDRQSLVSQYQGSPVTLSGDDVHAGLGDRVIRANGNVVATYAGDSIVADHIEIHEALQDQYLVANGHIFFTDPDGTVKADELRFCWKKGGEIATGRNVEIRIAQVTIKAATADMRPGKWVLTDYFLTNDRAKKPLLSVTGHKITVWPGHEADLESSQLNVLGGKLFGFAHRVFGLDPRTTGYPLPTPEYRNGKGLGYNWSGGSIIGPNTGLQMHSDASPGDIPGYGFELTKSLLPEDKQRYPITPTNPFSQRFAFGFFENVLVDKPSDEISAMVRPRASLSVSTTINGAATGRGASGEVLSVPGSVAFETGGRAGMGGYILDFRASMMDQYRQAYRVRGEFEGSYELPIVKLGPNLFNMARVDTALYQGGTSFGWGRGTESLIYQPIKPITLGAAGFFGANAGSPEFDIDPLSYKNGVALRADLRLGPRTASYMVRYDTQLGWFDHEFKITQAMGSLEAFVIYRKYPGDTHYGVTLRIDELQDLLTRRNRKAPQVVNSVGLP